MLKSEHNYVKVPRASNYRIWKTSNYRNTHTQTSFDLDSFILLPS